MGLFGAAGHSPNQVALATRKVCQDDEILERLAPCFPNWWFIAAHSDRYFGNQGAHAKRSGFPGVAVDWGAARMPRAARRGGLQSVAPPAVDKPVGQPYLCRTGAMAIAR